MILDQTKEHLDELTKKYAFLLEQHELAKAAIADLKHKFELLGGDDAVRELSNLAGRVQIADMKRNPKKYIP